jgi:hypothetical protein
VESRESARVDMTSDSDDTFDGGNLEVLPLLSSFFSPSLLNMVFITRKLIQNVIYSRTERVFFRKIEGLSNKFITNSINIYSLCIEIFVAINVLLQF